MLSLRRADDLGFFKILIGSRLIHALATSLWYGIDRHCNVQDQGQLFNLISAYQWNPAHQMG